MLTQIERYVKTAIVDKDPYVSSCALVSSIHLSHSSIEVVRINIWTPSQFFKILSNKPTDQKESNMKSWLNGMLTNCSGSQMAWGSDGCFEFETKFSSISRIGIALQNETTRSTRTVQIHHFSCTRSFPHFHSNLFVFLMFLKLF